MSKDIDNIKNEIDEDHKIREGLKKEYLTVEGHKKDCKVVTLEMKNHVSEAMKETMDEFDTKIFQPAFKKLLSAINGED